MRRVLQVTSLGVAAALLLSLAACSGDISEEKAREIAERARRSIQPIDAGALEQEVAPAVVKRVQTELTTLGEYMGPINGRLDSVTVNAFEAFQRKQGLEADGRFAEDTLRLLSAEAAKRG